MEWYWYTGWWFQTFYFPENIWDVILSHWRIHIFQRGGSTTNQNRTSHEIIQWSRVFHHVSSESPKLWKLLQDLSTVIHRIYLPTQLVKQATGKQIHQHSHHWAPLCGSYIYPSIFYNMDYENPLSIVGIPLEFKNVQIKSSMFFHAISQTHLLSTC